MEHSLVKAAALDFGIQWGGWVVAIFFHTEKFYDLAGSGTFFLLVYLSLQSGGTAFFRQKVNSRLVMIWAFRLGAYLVPRILSDGKDSRFDDVRDSPAQFFVYWTMQGLWVFVTLLPTLILNSEHRDQALRLRDYLGWGMWAAGFVIESVADYQKSLFKANVDNKGRFIRSGLWSVSRHPNYFGEILMWTGLYLSASAGMSQAMWQYVSVISPLFVTFLLTSVSGIPILEKSALERWGNQPDYQEYMRNTAVLVPYVW